MPTSTGSSYYPGTLILDNEVLNLLYARNPGSSKKRYTGDPYTCKVCKERIAGQSPSEHYRLYHQPVAKIRFADGKAQEVHRSSTSNLFQCPRCLASFRAPRHVQDHASSWDGKCARDSRSVNPSPVKAKASKRPAPTTNTTETPQKQPHRRQTAPSPQTVQNKTIARPLKTPTRTRTGIPQISRTFRAMIRQCYNQRVMSNKEIAEFCNCDVRDVYFAVNNESNDKLVDDQDYLDGKLGDIINIDDFVGLDRDGEDTEVFQVDEKIEMDMDAVEEDGPMDDVFTAQAESSVEAYPTPESDLPHKDGIRNDGAADSEEEIERDYIRVVHSPEPDRIVNGSPIKSTRRKGRSHRTQVNGSSKPSRSHRQAELKGPIFTFVSYLDMSSLEEPAPKMAQRMATVLMDYGVATSNDLDQLSKMDAYWGDVEQYFCTKGLTALHWAVIRDGLRARAMMASQW